MSVAITNCTIDSRKGEVVIDVSPDGQHVVMDGLYISRHVPLDFKLRCFALRKRWQLKRLLRVAG